MDHHTDASQSPTVDLPRLAGMVALVLVVAAIAYWLGISGYQQPAKAPLYELGMNQPGENKLEKNYRDADGDLVADPPTESAEWLDPPTIQFAYLAADQKEYAELWKPVLDKLSAACGRPIEFVTHESPDDELAAIQNGSLHLVGINSGSVPVAVNQCGFRPLVSFGKDGKLATYTMKIIARSDSDIKEVDDLRGKRLALTHPTSNSGWKAPLLLLLRKFDLKPIVDYDIASTGDHAKSIEALVAGEQVVVSVASDELQLAEEKGIIAPKDYRVIYESAPFCNNTFGCPYNLKPELADKLRQGMLELDWQDTDFDKMFSTIGATQFVPIVYQTDFSLIRDIDNAMGARTRELLGRRF
ncbi:MAG: phosphate/phosphite/phosphonate ABC transporter substrate-binding protein [Pirellulales bacterium]